MLRRALSRHGMSLPMKITISDRLGRVKPSQTQQVTLAAQGLQQQGVSVIDQEIDSGLSNFQDQSFDAVIMSQSIQALRKPEVALEEITRIGKEAIISIPNFANWRCRLQLIFGGTMPISSALPHDWYSTPNIHLCSLKDFERLCVDHGADILDRRLLSFNGEEQSFMKAAPNLLTEIALYRVKARN